MTKRLVIILLALALTALSIVPLAAQDADAPTIESVTGLARFFPDTTPLFVSWRIDDGYIGTLDTLVTRAAESFDLPLEQSLFDLLDETASQLPGGGTFDSTIRTWLGDTVAFGVLSLNDLFDDKPENDNTTPFLVALDITDRDAARAFFEFILVNNSYTSEETDAYTLFLPPQNEFFNESYVMITDDALFVSSSQVALPLETIAAPLSSASYFIDTFALLPEPTYNGTFFFNVQGYVDALAAAPQFDEMGVDFNALFEAISTVVSAQAVGFTILGDDSLVMDIAQPIGDSAAFEDAGFAMLNNMGAIDPAFARFMPSETALVVHGVNLRDSLTVQAQNLQAQIEMQAEILENSGMADGFDVDQIISSITTAGALFEGATGLDPIDDVLAWMDGDYAVILDVSDAATQIESIDQLANALPADFAIIIDATTDPEAAAAAVTGIGDALTVILETTEEVTITQETFGSANAYVLTVEIPDLNDPVQLVIGSDENVFVIGTERLVRFALSPDGGLDSDASYQDAQTYLLPDSSAVAYIFDTRLQNLLALAAGLANAQSDSQFRDASIILDIFGQSSISIAYGDDNTSFIRAVLTLPIGE